MNDIPFLIFEKNNPDDSLKWQNLILDKKWADSSKFLDLHQWLSNLEASSNIEYLNWAWLSTVWKSPSWGSLSVNEVNNNLYLWRYWLNHPVSDNLVKYENSRWEVRWFKWWKDAIYSGDAQPFIDGWNEIKLSTEHPFDDNLFWKSALATSYHHKDIGLTFWNEWKKNLSSVDFSDSLKTAWAIWFAEYFPCPKVFEDWLYSRSKSNNDFLRIMPLTLLCQHDGWLNQICVSLFKGLFEENLDQKHPTAIQEVWNIIPECNYRTRLEIAYFLLDNLNPDRAVKRWNVNYIEVENNIKKITNDIQEIWNGEDWLAGLFHIVPELVSLFKFNDMLPIDIHSAHKYLLLLKEDIRLKDRGWDISMVKSSIFDSNDYGF